MKAILFFLGQGRGGMNAQRIRMFVLGLALGFLIILTCGICAAQDFPPAQAQSLPADGSTIKGQLAKAGDANWYVIQVPEPASYKIELQGNTLKDSQITIFWANGWEYRWDPRVWWTPQQPKDEKIKGRTRTIACFLGVPGQQSTFYVRVQAKKSRETGTYAIRLTCNKNLFVMDFSTLKNLAYTSDRKVAVQATCTGNPQDYKVYEENPEKSDWHSFKIKKDPAGNPQPGTVYTTFDTNLSGDSGQKQLRFVVRDDQGFISESNSLSIRLKGVEALKVDGPEAWFRKFGHGGREDHEKWYTFKADKAGDYRIKLNGGVDLFLYDADGLPGQLKNVFGGFDTVQNLKPGSYLIQVKCSIMDSLPEGNVYNYSDFSIQIVHYDGTRIITDLTINDGAEETSVR